MDDLIFFVTISLGVGLGYALRCWQTLAKEEADYKWNKLKRGEER